LTNNENLDTLARGKVENLNVSLGEFNDIRLTVVKQSATLYVNNELVSRIELTQDFGNGSIHAGIGFISRNEVDNKETRFEDFTVWSVQ